MGFLDLLFGSKPQKRQGKRAFKPLQKAEVRATKEKLELEMEKAMNELKLKTNSHVNMWHMDEADWSINQDSGQIKFTDHSRKMIIVADVQIIGSYNSSDSTWLWGWSNPSIRDELKAESIEFMKYCKGNGYTDLSSPKLQCDQNYAWKIAALVCMVSNKQGVYRGPSGPTGVFVSFGEVKISKIK